MVLIYIDKDWFDTIGEMAGTLIIADESSATHRAVLAADRKLDPGYPFVEAHLARKKPEDESPFVLARIPANLVSGMFDVTTKAASKYGFHETQPEL